MLSLYAYNGLKKTNERALESVLFSVRQQAGVMAAICAAVFAVISALQTGKQVGSSFGEPRPAFGRPSHERQIIEEAIS